MDHSPRNVVYVTDGLSPWVVGGMQTVARRHIGWLEGAGHDVTVVHAMTENIGIKGVTMVRLDWPRAVGPARLSPWKYANELRRFSEGVSAVIDRVRPDAVYAEGPVLSAYLRRPRETQAPVVFHPHGLEMYQTLGSTWSDLRVRPLRSLMQQHARQADRVITQGGHLTAILRERLGVSEPTLAYLPNCLPADFPAKTQARPVHEKRFLFVGRPEPRKGLPLLLDAFRAAGHGATLDIVGSDGTEGARQDGLTYHGVVRDMQKRVDLFDRSDYLVVPSYSEGMATVILEAFGRAMPVIATDVGATRDLVETGKSGWLVPPANRDALASALRAACAIDDPAYASLSGRALLLATGAFSPETVRSDFLDLVADLAVARISR